MYVSYSMYGGCTYSPSTEDTHQTSFRVLQKRRWLRSKNGPAKCFLRKYVAANVELRLVSPDASHPSTHHPIMARIIFLRRLTPDFPIDMAKVVPLCHECAFAFFPAFPHLCTHSCIEHHIRRRTSPGMGNGRPCPPRLTGHVDG